MRAIFILISALIFVSGCIDNPVIPPEKNNSTFEIYFLKDTTLTIRDVMNSNVYPFITNLEELELADKPWITQDDIDFYEWSSHNIYLKKDKSYFFPGELQFIYRFPKSWTDRPWFVVANGIPCYAGYFGTEQSIDMYPFPEINMGHVGAWPTDILSSTWAFWFVGPDIRFNELVKDALIQCGLYHGGIEVSIDTTNSPVRVYADTTAEYTLKFQNNDQDNIYICDPYKTFHIFTGVVYFKNIETDEFYYTKNPEAKPWAGWPNEFDRNWYTLLKSGESVKRTFRLKCYRSTFSYPKYPSLIPPGIYLLQTGQAGGPVTALERSIRETPQGRYFVPGGEVHTDTVRVTIARIYEIKNYIGEFEHVY